MSYSQTLMLSRALDADFSEGYEEIQGKLNDAHAQNEALVAERLVLAEKIKTLEDQAKGFAAEREGFAAERAALQEEVEAEKSARAVLQEDVQAEKDLSSALGISAWEAMVSLEDSLKQLGAVLPARCHRPSEIDITLQRLRGGCEVCIPAARAYGDHCAKAAWLTTLASVDKAGCAHIDALGTRSVAVATAEEVSAAVRRTRKASKVLQQDFWVARGHDAAAASFQAVQAQQAKGKSPAEDLEAGKRGSSRGDKV